MCLLIKRAGERNEITATAQFVKLDKKLGLAFFWAFKSTDKDGNPYHDLQGDQVVADDEMIKAAAEFMENGGAVDEMHDSEKTGRVVFAMPMNGEIAAAFGVTTKQSGLMIALKPSAEALKKLESGEYTAVSIAGEGERTAAKRHHYDANKRSAICKGVWSTATVDDFPDSSFLYVEPGGKEDDSGKTTPRSLRHFPYRDENGKIDIDHLRDAIGRIPQSSLPATLRNKLQAKAEKLLAAQHTKRAPTGKCADCGASMAVDASKCEKCGGAMAYKRIAKVAVLTSEEDGHQHSINVDDPAVAWMDSYSTSYATSEGADAQHCHAWTFDPSTGAITIAADSGHTHDVADPVPPDVLAVWRRRDAIGDAENMREAAAPMLISDDPSDGVPYAMPVEESSGAVRIAIEMRDKSTPKRSGRSVKSQPEGTMPTEHEKQIADLTKRNERLERIAKMSGAHKAHLDTLKGEDAEAFIAKSATERDAVLADVAKRLEETNKIVYTSKSTGAVYRASDDPRLLELAKRDDASAEKIEKAEVREVAKAHLGCLAGGDDTHDYIVRSIRKGGGDQATIDKALAAMKGWNELGKSASIAKGINPGDPVAISKADAYAALSEGLVAFCEEKKIAKVWTEGLDAFAKTKAGGPLVEAYNTAKKATA